MLYPDLFQRTCSSAEGGAVSGRRAPPGHADRADHNGGNREPLASPPASGVTDGLLAAPDAGVETLGWSEGLCRGEVTVRSDSLRAEPARSRGREANPVNTPFSGPSRRLQTRE
ncbi:hypothetical protein AOLI_G00191420 [Acnodon oligacanthus]